jgi:hypothetical protein
MEYENGDVYDGKWVNDMRDGFGIMKFKSGDTYEGDWKLDKKRNSST